MAEKVNRQEYTPSLKKFIESTLPNHRKEFLGKNEDATELDFLNALVEIYKVDFSDYIRTHVTGLYELIDSEKMDKILVWELSRLGRSTLEVLKSLERFHDNGVSLYVHNYNIETLNPDGSVNPMAQLMITMLAEFSRTERTAIQQRLNSGYQKYRAEGGKVGRKSGSQESKDEFLKKHSDVVKLLKKNTSIRNVSKLTEKSTKTIQKVKNLIKL